MDVALNPEDLLTPAGLEQFHLTFSEDGTAMARIGLRGCPSGFSAPV